ncbi:hypothetical protein [Arcanobacterium phocae]|uniref:hypothetical protein n=1 Tax=Arcanobacterium phocae TaxID=131112 RepID=UPI001C0F337A|nr:hypothetical protein [Arcanobacterium phocae]
MKGKKTHNARRIKDPESEPEDTTSTNNKTFYERWICIYRLDLLHDYALKIAVIMLLFLIGVEFIPSFGPLSKGLKIRDAASLIVSISGISLSISIALAAVGLALPGKVIRENLLASTLREAHEGNGKKESDDPIYNAFKKLAFIAFWAGLMNITTASFSIALAILLPEEELFTRNPSLPSICGSFMLALLTYSLLQTLDALKALLQTQGSLLRTV